MKKQAILFSGGIGDYLHYIVRIDDFLVRTSLKKHEITVIVESTNAARVKTLFSECLPGFDIHFMPDAIHWTKTNPLLDVNNEYDRINRPAFLHASLQGFEIVADWFLPFLCMEYESCKERLNVFLGHSTPSSRIYISARNKGCTWWPSKPAISLLASLLKEKEFYFVGTPDEQLKGLTNYISFPSVFDALLHVSNCSFFVGTDTGFATLRELLGMKNIYCVDEYWYKELMVKYSYWTEDMARKSKSEFAFNLEEFECKVVASLESMQDASPACSR